ncbi:hypothetical protein SLGD_00350 [Staphylococcus lugdunensis HKU09-01]|jgi:hypothetical protein|nr:hypothetical protein SLGD_00350 [Staphylococcus lugdunensis HKU09-01]CCB52764.1 hypothetical uncharacterized protein [Staphylococcus lugdunensis N920143]
MLKITKSTYLSNFSFNNTAQIAQAKIEMADTNYRILKF